MSSADGDAYHDIPRILMFSDIEGCQKHNAPKPNLEVKQSGFLCNPAFYAEIRRRLDADAKLHVAFLGDYFDQGMGVYDSIKGMNDLLNDFSGRVHVILGNRDVNKLRFCFELAKKDEVVGIPDGQTRWGVWSKFHNGLESKKNDEVALVNHILFESMGAKIDMNTNDYNPAPDAKLIGLHSFLPLSITDEQKQLSDEQKQDSQLALKYLKVSLGIEPRDNDTQDALDLLGFFKKCKIAHVFNGKVLLAHGGGFDPEAFFDQAYVDSFKEGAENITPENYHSTLEKFRRKLSGQEVQKGGKYGKEVGDARARRIRALEFGNNASDQNRNKPVSRPSFSIDSLPPSPDARDVVLDNPEDKASAISTTQTFSAAETAVESSVNAYNKLLEDVLNEISGENPLFTWKFVLLQALGLKPDNEDARYKSLIQSCIQEGCKGPNPPLSTDKDQLKLAKILKDSGITHVSYGHKPICFPIPVIYKRPEIDGVTFISNDTSNANRKVEEIGENTAIGTMVIFDAKNNRVQSKIEPVELSRREAKVGNYSAMFEPLTLQTTPSYKQDSTTGAYVLKYGIGTVGFNIKGPKEYDQLRYTTDETSGITSMPGGKRRSRHRKQQKSKRGSKRGGSKRTRHNKHKHTQRGRKARK
jgi:hypothetical protein